MVQRSLDRVVRWRDSFDTGEAPQTFLDLKKFEACRRRLHARVLGPFQKGLLHRSLQAAHSILKRTPSQGSVTYSVPVAEQPVESDQGN